MSRVLDIVRTLRTTPPLPSVAFHVLEIVRDPDYSIDRLVGIVRTDPSLTARVLRLTNSAVFGVPSEISSVADAVAYVGSRNLVKLVLVSCAANHFQGAGNSLYGGPEGLWKHTFAVATACQWLAVRSGYEETDTAFTAGILHNIGKVALSQLTDEPILTDLQGATNHTAAERALFGIDHATAAGVIADSWTLPRELTKAIRHHHDDRKAAGETPLPAILELADTLVLAAGIGNAFPDLPLVLSASGMEHLHLNETDIENATAHVMAELERNAELLNLKGISSR